MVALDRIRGFIEAYCAKHAEAKGEEDPSEDHQEIAIEAESALARLCEAFRLSEFERDILLLCVGSDLDGRFARAVAATGGRPSFGMALTVLPKAHWSAIAPSGPLRYWRLIEPSEGDALTCRPLRVDERVLHFLMGVASPDERLRGVMRALKPPKLVAPSQRKVVARVLEAWRGAESGRPLIELHGRPADARVIAAAAAAAAGWTVHQIDSASLTASGMGFQNAARLIEREAVLSNRVPLIDATDVDASNIERLNAMVEALECPTFLCTTDSISNINRSVIRIEAPAVSPQEISAVWRGSLGPLAKGLNGELDRVSRQFPLQPDEIAEVAASLSGPGMEDCTHVERAAVLWKACRGLGRDRFGSLAHRIEPGARWGDLVLPEVQLRTLQQMAAHVRNRWKVYETWGFAGRGSRGLGISALFSGPSGAGKTMAAEVLGSELELDLFRIDLSAVCSKYIGETEKNLKRIFDAAEASSAILLFDEADALFGKRSEIKDSHDRYANTEVAYLLQRMESFCGRGLAILTTNAAHGALDQAFWRRLRFSVSFPFPDAAARREIWVRVFPPTAPTESLDFDKLSQLNVSGASIRNIALNAAFLSAEAGEPICVKHILQAAHAECAKLEKPLGRNEIAGWV
ncbi:MAG TPA: ATP-binding protein [Phycisphaerae bacterium]|nr:ATP-binding protein [Phycisphaerae bacterium]